ncbi:hypothetical protein [Dyadobacter sediminis]|uniref:Uncharacterized protein n=1 Tax=Dyadobacter sediminis TaxID=1493691 RepID=A0A5R9KHV6_9BACT|nr:hypothetical protein [Dyadobacter sediminis]TLU95785.1 hypothetical protein FEM55_01090 [Dyadobacter sediminis]GGB76547.1 hypothetical protein GCM10011325_00050 [Dyadobacter sediminis]
MKKLFNTFMYAAAAGLIFAFILKISIRIGHIGMTSQRKGFVIMLCLDVFVLALIMIYSDYHKIVGDRDLIEEFKKLRNRKFQKSAVNEIEEPAFESCN